jgi:hypothetical protein
MPWAGIELATPAIERRQANAADRTATGIGNCERHPTNLDVRNWQKLSPHQTFQTTLWAPSPTPSALGSVVTCGPFPDVLTPSSMKVKYSNTSTPHPPYAIMVSTRATFEVWNIRLWLDAELTLTCLNLCTFNSRPDPPYSFYLNNGTDATGNGGRCGTPDPRSPQIYAP